MKTKRTCLLTFAALGLAFAASGGTFTNLTPLKVPENPSGIYTFSFSAHPAQGKIAEDSVKAFIVIDEKTISMKPSPVGKNIFEHEYHLPEGQNAAKYYYILEYQAEVERLSHKRRRHLQTRTIRRESDLYKMELINRYVIQPESDRGPAGARIAVVGRGFSPSDKILFGGRETETACASPNSMSFIIPRLEAGKTYPVTLLTSMGEIAVGSFRIDPGAITVEPSSLSIPPQGSIAVEFQASAPAPAGGLYIDVKTDVPQSVIMPKVVIPEGETSVTVTVEGGPPGKGKLIVKAPGCGKTEIPVNVE